MISKLLYEITHTTTYDYGGEVALSHHLLRLAPRQSRRQSRLEHRLSVSPAFVTLASHYDYFGNTTHFLAVENPHQQLKLRSHSRVAIAPAYIPEPLETPAWELVRAMVKEDHSQKSLEAHEFIYPSPLVPLSEEFREYATPSFAAGRPVLDAVADLTRRIHEELTFDTTATTVSTPVVDVLKHRRGVCQDFAHFQLACLRSQGLPARYVSGYIETDPPPEQPKMRGIDASHAWVSFLCPGIGWVDVDPTNNCLPSLRHLTLAWGRDYSDVAPVRGMLVGAQSQHLSVSVDVVALGPISMSSGVGSDLVPDSKDS